jgi:UDP-N-acetyl-2-amino-2-deoxyglucuronate dehydrogenase
MAAPMGFAIVGCGMIARFHVRAIQEIEGASVAALVSRSATSGAKLIAETGIAACPVVETVDAAVVVPGVDAVIVTSPSGAHREPAIAAARAGKHVVVEKPLEITPARCDDIITACERHGVQLCTIFPSRFGDANRELKAAMAAGRFGRLTFAETMTKAAGRGRRRSMAAGRS